MRLIVNQDIGGSSPSRTVREEMKTWYDYAMYKLLHDLNQDMWRQRGEWKWIKETVFPDTFYNRRYIEDKSLKGFSEWIQSDQGAGEYS